MAFLLSGLNHFIYCRRCWWLANVEGVWEENEYTTKGHLFHESVHNPSKSRSINGVLSIRGLQVRSETLNLEGVCDAVEFIQDDNGVHIPGHRGTWSVHPVEYKSGGKRGANDNDAFQLVAQAVCLEEMLGCRIDKGYIYYNKTHSRVEVEISDERRSHLKETVAEMSAILEKGEPVPVPDERKACKACSLLNLCNPEVRRSGVRRYMEEGLE